MLISSFFIDVKKIHIAHEFILDRAHRCEYPAGRGQFGLVYALSGGAEYRFFDGTRVTLGKGDVIFLSSDAAYAIITEKEFRHFTVNFDIHRKTSRPDILNSPYSLLKEKNTDRLEHDFKKLVGIWNEKAAGFEMQATGALYTLLSHFYRDFTEETGEKDERLTPIKEYIERNFEKQITLSSLASFANMSVTNFRREWKKRYGIPPLRYRDELRLHYAKEYLSSGYYTVSEIAERCGYDDVSYFVRFFKRKTGHTPGEIKKQFLGG